MAKLVIQSAGAPVEVLELQPGIHTIGRSPDNDFEICHASVSSRHCEIELCAEGLFVRDLGSTNGTFVDGVQVVEETPLKSGQTLRLGEVACEVKDAAAAVAIPQWSEPQAPETLPDGSKPCVNHPGFPANMRCTHCKKLFCGNCVHILRRTKGMILKLCPICSHPCESLEGMNVVRQKGFMDFLKKTFRVPRLRK